MGKILYEQLRGERYAIDFAKVGVACNFNPSAEITFKTVANSGLPSADSALYKLSRPRPVSFAICDMPLARAISPSSLSDYGNRRQKLAAQSQILPIFYVNIEHIDSKMGEIWVVQADFEPI